MRRGAVRHRGPVFWTSAVVGWLIIAWGLRGALHHHVDTRPADLLRFVVFGVLIHDLLFAPLALAAGLVIARVVPGPGRTLVQAALTISGVVALFAYPEVRGYGRALHNPTSLPHNYASHLAVVIVAVACATALVGGTRAVRRRQKAASPPSPPP